MHLLKLADGQRAICKWFGQALDVALPEETAQVPVNKRTQSACLLIGAGGTGKTTIILELLLPTFLEFFPPQDGEDRYAILICLMHKAMRFRTRDSEPKQHTLLLATELLASGTEIWLWRQNESIANGHGIRKSWWCKMRLVFFRPWFRTCCFTDPCEADRMNTSCGPRATDM